MTDIENLENPWEDITDDIFPKRQTVISDDKRFFVSKKRVENLYSMLTMRRIIY